MYKKCMAALDYSTADETLICSVQGLQESYSFEYLHYVHVSTDDAPCGDHPHVRDIEITCLSGKPESALADFSRENEIELSFVGLKKKGERNALVARKLLLMTNTDVLFIPASVKSNIQHILVPIDLAPTSGSMVEKVAQQFESATIDLFFASFIPPAGIMDADARKARMEAYREEAEAEMQKFIDALNIDRKRLTYNIEFTEHFNAAFPIYEYVSRNDTDLIAIGRLSKVSKELPFLGSVTEKLLTLEEHIPILVINHQ